MNDAVLTEVPDQNVLARALGIVTSPGATFEVVKRFPRPASMLFLVCVVMAMALGGPQFTARGRQPMLDSQVQQMEKFMGTSATPEMYAGMERRAPYIPYLTIGSMFIFIPVVSLLVAAVYWFVFNAVLGGAATFKQVLAVVTHSQVISALGAVVGAPIQYFQDTYSQAGPFNLGAVAPMLEPGGFGASFLGSLSIFMLWQLIVTAIGLGVLYRRKATVPAVVLTVVYLALMAGVTLAFSRSGAR
ncbi:MAG: Yip1 family protein [Vicinamibacterales bacterium]